MTVPPASAAAEWQVVAHMIDKPMTIPEVVGIQLESRDFASTDAALLYATATELYYSDLRVDPVIVGERLRPSLSKLWNVAEGRVYEELTGRIARAGYAENVLEHAHIVKRLSVSRQLLKIAIQAQGEIADGRLTPQEIGDRMSAEALKVTSETIRRSELLTWMEVGTEYAKHLRRQRIAREQGIELAVYTGLPFIDDWTMGIAPGELMFLAGDPGVGKTAIAWSALKGFADRQLMKLRDQQMATLVLSLEMSLIASTARQVQALTKIDGMRLRSGDISDREWKHILRDWKDHENLPIFFNFASSFRLSQMRALIVEAIRKYNVGFVVIDHFRQIDADQKFANSNDADEAKVRFLKEEIAKDLNVAVLCLAHTIKVGRGEGDRRPKLSDLRGSGQISAHADFVAFMYRPAKHAGPEEMSMGAMDETDAELVWSKNRHGTDGIAPFYFEPTTMTARARY
jgi:replicative DNA helicase